MAHNANNLFFKFLSELQIVLESDGEASLDVAFVHMLTRT